MSETLELTKQLIARRSITPKDAGCQDLLIQRLEAMDFAVERLPFADVDNLWTRHGDENPVLVFIGHTDVVPTGPLAQWSSDPFQPEVRDGKLYGRGAADMKGGVAAFITACEDYIGSKPNHRGSIALLITSDEEGPSVNGTKKVVEFLQQRGDRVDWCIVGEPSGEKKLGDTIKIGRRGSVGGTLTVYGKQGHIAYPHKIDNPIHRVSPVLHELLQTQWDQGNQDFDPTGFQISNINAGTGATNVIPGELQILFNFRYSPEVTAEHLQQRVHKICDQYLPNYHIDWRISGQPFYTQQGELIDAAKKAIQKVTGIDTHPSTSGGTSDGRFMAKMGCQIVEIGVCNASIHQIDEHVLVSELDDLGTIYLSMLEQLLG